MADRLFLQAAWEAKRDGTPEERATFAALGVRADDLWLTEAEDRFVGRIREAPLLSAYPLAEWLAWNWWRLRWEPRRNTRSWAFAHRVSGIGGGHVWPDLTFDADGERIELIAAPTASRPAEPLRYVTSAHANVSAAAFERAVDAFLAQTLDRLAGADLRDTNLQRIAADLAAEREDAASAAHRRMEARLGFDPDGAPDGLIERLLAAQETVGPEAVGELAAAATASSAPSDPAELEGAAWSVGVDARLDEAIRVPGLHAHPGGAEPWKLGVRLADTLRARTGLGLAPVTDALLGDMSALSRAAFEQAGTGGGKAPVSFALAQDGGERVVFRSRLGEERRFEVARLLGDVSLAAPEPLRPITRALTFRQMAQRACAAQLLCPYDGLVEQLDGDFEHDAQQAAADYYGVSPSVVRHQLTNNQASSLHA